MVRFFPMLLPSRSHSLRFAVPLAALLAAACAPVPKLGPKPVPRGSETIAAERSLPAQADATWPGEGWWRQLGDSQLDALIEEGLRSSPDVAAASARYRRAAGLAQEARGATLPTLDVQGQARFEKQSYNQGIPKEFVPKGWQDTGQVAAVLGFDIDLWGKNSASLSAATSDQRAAAIDAQQARLMIAIGVASGYVDLQRLFEERDVRAEELRGQLAAQKLVSQRRANGLETRGSERQTDAQVGNARSALGLVDQQIAVRRNQLAALIGAGPDRGLDIQRPSLPTPAARGLPAGVTTDLIGRRPDIASARERVEAAASRIKVARADFFPALRLDALFGLQSLGLGNLIESDSTYGRVGPAISLPIFHGGAIQGRYRGARATYDEAVADYDRTVLAAYQQVADAVTTQRTTAQRLADARAALAASEDAYTVARARYEGGLSNFLDVLVVEDRLLDARLAVAALNADLRSADVALIRALGGGFDPAVPLPEDKPHG